MSAEEIEAEQARLHVQVPMTSRLPMRFVRVWCCPLIAQLPRSYFYFLRIGPPLVEIDPDMRIPHEPEFGKRFSSLSHVVNLPPPLSPRLFAPSIRIFQTALFAGPLVFSFWRDPDEDESEREPLRMSLVDVSAFAFSCPNRTDSRKFLSPAELTSTNSQPAFPVIRARVRRSAWRTGVTQPGPSPQTT